MATGLGSREFTGSVQRESLSSTTKPKHSKFKQKLETRLLWNMSAYAWPRQVNTNLTTCQTRRWITTVSAGCGPRFAMETRTINAGKVLRKTYFKRAKDLKLRWWLVFKHDKGHQHAAKSTIKWGVRPKLWLVLKNNASEIVYWLTLSSTSARERKFSLSCEENP